VANGVRHPGSVGVRRPDRSVRMQPGSFTQDPGMRARDQFTDVGSAGYREQAKRVAERGGAKEYATSVEEESAAERADLMRNIALTALSIALPAARVVQMNKALQGAVTAARATPAGQGLVRALSRNAPVGTTSPWGSGLRDSPTALGYLGGTVGSGLVPAGFQGMAGELTGGATMDNPEDMWWSGLFGQLGGDEGMIQRAEDRWRNAGGQGG
jgi:hypothetical protein